MSANSYDLAPYPRLSHYFCQPARAATVAHLWGLTPPSVEGCRVLEVGCASGGNLIPLAVAFPESEFVGVDASGRQVMDGREDIAHLGLKNVSLHPMSLEAIDAAFGKFDYILAHGLYSWVPAPVRDRLMAICSENLTPQGVAYISYNTYPGWHSMEALRRMMLYYVRRASEPAERAAKALALLDFLASAADPADHYGVMLSWYNNLLRQAPSAGAYVLHEHLEEVNEPLYFHEFAEHAARHNLQYLGDADFRMDFMTTLPKAKVEALLAMSHDLIELGQHMDFVRNRMFRQTLLVHADLPVSRRLGAARLHTLWVGSSSRPESREVELGPGATETFNGRDGSKLSTDHPLSKAAMVCLIQRWPAQIPFDGLVAKAQATLAEVTGSAPAASDDPEQIEVLAANLLQAFACSESLVQFFPCAPRFSLEAGPRPRASPWARLEAEAGADVTNLRHERINLDPLQRQLLRQLDGTRDRPALLAEFEPRVLDAKLDELARSALLLQP